MKHYIDLVATNLFKISLNIMKLLFSQHPSNLTQEKSQKT